MKKKVLYGAVMALLAVSSMGTLQSCKDDLEDVKTQTSYNLNEAVKGLQAQIDAIKAQADQCRTECQAKIADLQTKINNLKNQADKNTTDIAQLKTDLAELAGQIKNLVTLDQLKADLNALETKLTTDLKKYIDEKDELAKQYADTQDAALKKNLEQQIAALETKINTLVSSEIQKVTSRIDQLDADYQGKFTDLQNQLNATNTTLDQVQKDIIAIQVELDTKQKAIDAINTQLLKINETLSNINLQLGDINSTIQGIINDFKDLQKKYDAQLADLNSALEEAFGMIYQNQEFITQWGNLLQDQIDELASKVDGIHDAIATLEDKYDALTLRINSLITGIIIQAAESPVFGNFSLPIGVQSNMLFNWYGENLGLDYNFPTTSRESSYDGEAPALTAADLAFLGASSVRIPNGYLADEFSLGNVYMTVNPVGHNFDATNFSLETSAGKALPYEVRVTPSDKELYFGYSRSVANGFYEGEVVMPATDAAVTATRVTIDEGLKTAVKDILKDRSKRNAFNLLRAVYDQMNGLLPAYGLRYDKYYMDRSSYSILSKYELAVATAKPLSYKFFYDKSIDHRLRKFGHLNNIFDDLIDKDKFKFELNTTFTIDKFTIKFEDLTFNFDIKPKVTFDDKIVVTAKTEDQTIPVELTSEDGQKVTGNVVVPGQDVEAEITGDNMQPLIDAIIKGIQDSMKEMSDDLGNQINQQIREKLIAGIQDQVNNMLDDIQSQINKMLKDLESQINGQISDMIDDVMNTIESKTEPIFNRVNKIIDLYNRVADKINNFLEDPNHYLQPAIFYKNNGGVGILSNVKNDPTILVKAGGNAFSFYLSSYSAEIVAPAFKKFVAVTNVYDANGNSVLSANSSDVKAINANSAMFNKVLTGNTIRAAVNTTNMKAGLTYELVYQAVDYSGVTSTQKFYIKVK
ncbi:MAG: hypothetical protein NC095_01670 [Muribaculum sp.]|nr:hypothetical protein [Muribaculum sp.]